MSSEIKIWLIVESQKNTFFSRIFFAKLNDAKKSEMLRWKIFNFLSFIVFINQRSRNNQFNIASNTEILSSSTLSFKIFTKLESTFWAIILFAKNKNKLEIKTIIYFLLLLNIILTFILTKNFWFKNFDNVHIKVEGFILKD